MTHQNYQTNGASLEDCHTNFFALADLCGIKWKKLGLNERPHATGDPLDDPVLKSYTKCLAKDLLCVWRRVSQHKNDLDQTGGLGMFDINQTMCTSATHPPLSLTASKELWIFWYGEEPDLTDLVTPELLKSSDSTEQGSWENGLSYECRSLLFKALHNLIERCLLSRDIVRLGKWFVQPSIGNYGKSSSHLSFSFAFFVHGDSTVCASMDIREHPSVRTLTEEYLNEVITNSQQNIDDVDEKNEFNDIKSNNTLQSVILAPFGLSAVLTGNKIESSEQHVDKIINDWNAFYPMKSNNCSENESSSTKALPQLVEVISGGVKMLYPSKYVLITDIDMERKRDVCANSENSGNNSKKCITSEKRIIKKLEDFNKDSIESNLLMNICDGIQKSSSSMPERVWQDLIMNPAYTGDKSEKNQKISENNAENSINVANTENSASTCNGGLWNFTEPCLKTSCACKRSGSFSSLKAPGNSSSLSGKSNFRNNSNRTRTPFHKRSESSLSRSKDCRFSNEPTSSKKFTIRSEKNSISTSSSNNSCNQGNEVQQTMSIGSVGSITASPMQQNLSVNSQPSSIPIHDQTIISPHPNDVSPHPLTPILESNNGSNNVSNISSNNHDQKPENDDLKSMTNVNGQMNNKHDSKLQRQSQKQDTLNVNEASTVKIPNGPLTSGGASKQGETFSSSSLKRPALLITDCENNDEEDFMTNQSLYDYSTWDAWMAHPIKRFKAEDFDRNKTTSMASRYNLYSGQKHIESTTLPSQTNVPSFLAQTIKSEITDEMKGSATSRLGGAGLIKIKTENDSEKMSTESIFASEEGLQPSESDINKIFDNSDDNSNDDHLVDNTPPGSNNSINCHPDMDLPEHDKREKMPFNSPFAINSNGLTNMINNASASSTLGIIRSEELSKMFPTPPSIEQHTNSSPGGIGSLSSDNLNDNIDNVASSSHNMDAYQNFGSPPEEPIEDWSYVFVAPKMSSIVNSSKYAPLNNLLCQKLPPITLPNECNYKPSWVKQKEQQAQQQKTNQVKEVPKTEITTKKDPIDQKPMIDIKKEIKMEPMSPLMSTKPLLAQLMTPNMKTSTDANANPIINKLLSQKSSLIYPSRGLPPALESPNSFQGNPYNSPYGSGSAPPMMMNNMINRMGMGTPSHPPPPYEMHAAKMNQSRVVGQPLSSTGSISKASEANSLLVNVLLYDSSLNIFRDHNFDSCTICVCNASTKCVGNIRGLDSGIYLSLASNCHFNSNLSAIVDKSFENQNVDPKSLTRYVGNSRNLINTSENEGTKCSQFNSMTTCSSCTQSIPTAELASALVNNPPQLNLNGIHDDEPIPCSCGFSAVINRRLAHQTGLFFEDEMEITGMARDPSNFKKRSLMALLKGDQNENRMMNISEPGSEDKGNDDSNSLSITASANASISMAIFDLIRDQCSLFQNSSNTVQRTIKHLNQERYSSLVPNKQVNILEYIDALDIVSLALEQSRYIFERFDGYNNRQVNYMQQQQPLKNQLEKKSSSQQNIISVHTWPFLNASGPKSNQDIIRVMKSMKVLLQKVFNQNGTTGLWDAPYDVRGPLTWREFHRLAGRGIGQCEPQPIPSIVVGHEKEWLCISPYALQFWDKLLLEPYSYPRDIAYIVITPDNDYITSRVKAFFKELSTTYEMCRLGKHQPVKGWEGILKVGKPVLQNKRDDMTSSFDSDEWLKVIDNNRLNELLKLYSAAFQQHLVPYLSRIPQDQTLLNPPENFYNYKDHHHHRTSTSLPSPMLPPHTPESSNSNNPNAGPNTPKSDHDTDKDNLNNSAGGNDLMIQPQQQGDQVNPPHIVLYIVEPFTSGTDSTSLERVACLSLLKQYSHILNSIPESVKMNITLKIISQESILELGKSRDVTRWSDHMKNMALSVFTQAHRYLQHTNNVKSLTGFGTAATAEAFMKTKDEKNKIPVKLYTPPYILSTRNAKSENVENFGQAAIEQQCTSIMYCCYCLSEDQSMLLAVITDERGEFLENCAINIDIPNRKRRRRSSARRIALKKLMDFILGVISQTVRPWRLVIGRIGRIGHGELKGWSWLLSKPNLVNASKYLKEICKQCQIMYTQAVPSIWSACLVTLEPDSSFRVMADQFTPDERFSQRSTQSPLSTPQDVTCTHILVFPTSAVCQSSHTAFQEEHLDPGYGFGEDLGMGILGDDGEDVEDEFNGMGIQNLFDDWNDSTIGLAQQGSPTRDSHRGSPIQMDESKSGHTPGMADAQSGSSRAMFLMNEQEEVGTLLQQPLALGYFVSTAPTGRMPSWFWASCPHLENVCPVFLKTALHIHSPSVHKENDDIYFKEQSSRIEHPLDSNTTADVLRYVLEGYNVLSWLAMDSNTHDRLSCLPIHVQNLMQLYHLHTALA